MVQLIATKTDFDAFVKENALVVVDFTASWCGPCRMIGPKFEEMSKMGEFSNVKFIKVDVDENSDTAEACGISAMPTFQFFKDGKKVADVVGASEEKLKQMIKDNM